MSINLLPGEEKLKVKKQQQQRAAPRIELTGPVKPEKKKRSGVEHAGVLSFFKRPFQRPKVDVVKKEAERAAVVPQKKILLEEKLIAQKSKATPQLKPRIEFQTPKKITEKAAPPTTERSLFSRIFGGGKHVQEKKIPAVSQPKPVEQFPKYKSVRAVKVTSQPIPKKRIPQVVHVAANGKKQAEKKGEPQRQRTSAAPGFPKVDPRLKATRETVVPAPQVKKEKQVAKGPSAWERFTNWLQKLFGRKKPDLHPALLGKSLPAATPPPSKSEIFRAERITEVPAQQPQQNIPVREPSQPHVPELKRTHMEPAKAFGSEVTQAIEVSEKKSQHVEKEVPPQKPTPPLTATPPSEPKKEVPPQAVVHAEKVEVKKEEPPKKSQKEKAEKKGGGFGAWMRKLLSSIAALFKKKEKHPQVKKPQIFPPPVVKEEAEHHKDKLRMTEVPREAHHDLHAPSFIAPSAIPVPSTPEIESKSPEQPAVQDAPPPPVEHTELPQAEPDAIKEPASQHIEAQPAGHGVPPPPPPPPRSDSMAMTKPKVEKGKQPAINWEINLIPEGSIPQQLPVVKLLYLGLFVIAACGLVFGGWLGANFYYNNITKNVEQVKGEIRTLISSVKKYDNLQDEIKDLNAQVKEARTLIEKHVHWSDIFIKLETHTIPEVYYSSMVADVNGVLRLTAVGKNYEAAVKQLLVYEQATDFVQIASVSGIRFIGGGPEVEEGEVALPVEESADREVSFLIELTVLPSIFYYSP